MKLQQVAPGQGTVWVRNAFRVFLRQPLGFASLFAAGLFASLVLGLVPVLGSIATLALAPAVSLVFMIASRRVRADQAAMPGAIVELFGAGRTRLMALVKLGLAYVAATFLLFWLATVLDGGALASFFNTLKDARLTPEIAAARVAEPGVQFGLMLRLLFLGLLSIAFWHAPALVFWGDPSWVKSLFFSTVALWRNKGAFAIYSLVWLALFMVLLAIVSIGAGLFGPERFALVAAPLMLVFMTVFYASLWFTFADCFTPSDPVTASPRDDVDPPDPLTKGSS
ncbi:MAG TPA: BPSS1780 family membrane protein [Caldimonas sp.]|nr:BPSS1780 family membrane protein [Caldimonas sp.]